MKAAAERRWECLAQEWVTVLARHRDATATVQYPDGSQQRVAEWVLEPWREE